MTDLWSETIGTVKEKSPVAILREQAALLVLVRNDRDR